MNKNNSHSKIMKWVECDPKETNKGLYFDYKYELKRPSETMVFGGSSGYFINKESRGLILPQKIGQ